MEQKSLPNATASLVLGILSIPTCCFYGLGLVLGIIAIVLGKKAKKLHAENPDMYTGIGNAKAGYVTGIIGLILTILYIIFVIIIVAAFGWAVLQDPELLQEKLSNMQ